MAPAADGGGGQAEGTVVVGTYDGGLLGFRASDGAQIFGYAPHAGCVKAVRLTKAGRLASGGTDHIVRLFDLAKGVEVGELQEHQDSVLCLDFWGTSNLVTGSSDGQVCVWRCSDWELLLKFRAHRAAVACLAVHPSGRMMASAGRDASLRLWDLTRGTSAATVPCDEPVEAVEWSASGSRLAALGPREVFVVDVAGSGAVASYRDPNSAGLTRVTLSAVMFLRDSEVLLGDGKGDLRAMQFQLGKGGDATLPEVCRLPADAERLRVKAFARTGRGEGDAAASAIFFAVGMSSGRVEVWRFDPPPGGEEVVSASCFDRLRVVDTRARLTCLDFWRGAAGARLQAKAPLEAAAADESSGKAKKRKRGAAP